MMRWIYTAFDEVSEFITRLPLIMLVLLAFMGYRYYEVQTLFLRTLPEDITERHISAGLIAGVFIFSTIIFMVHAFRIHASVKLALFFTALVINIFFWQAADFFTYFISLVLSLFDIGFSYLFHLLRREKEVQRTIKELENRAISIEEETASAEDKLKEVQARALELKRFIDKHTCPHCKEPFPSPKSVNAHKSRCSLNTKKQ